MIQKLLDLLAVLKGANGAIVMGALLAMSEALALIPSVKANSIFQAVVNGLVWIKDKLSPKPPVV